MARRASTVARLDDPLRKVEAEWQAVSVLADELKKLGHDVLAWLLLQRPTEGPPLLVAAVRYFFI